MSSVSASERLKLEYLASREAIFQTAVRMRHECGHGAGPDGITPAFLTKSELGKMAELCSRLVLTGCYRPGPRRLLSIPKPAGGFRVLRIPNFCDRVVARVLKNALEPFLNPQFVTASYGFRPRLSTWDMLADIKQSIESSQQTVLVVADVRRAFDSIPIDELMESFERMFSSTEIASCNPDTYRNLLELTRRLLTGGKRDHKIGIATGCPFSPIALNVYYHDRFDSQVLSESQTPSTPPAHQGFRYADNLVFRAGDVSEGQAMLDELRQHFERIKTPLKSDAGVFDLKRGDSPGILGFAPQLRESELTFGLTEEAEQRLALRIDKAYETTDPAAAAGLAVAGWMAQMGPAFETSMEPLNVAARVLRKHGFRESYSEEQLQSLALLAQDQWTNFAFGVGYIDPRVIAWWAPPPFDDATD